MKTERQRQLDLTLAIVDLEFDDETIARAKPRLLEGIARVERGETTQQEEEERLLAEWRKIHAENQ